MDNEKNEPGKKQDEEAEKGVEETASQVEDTEIAKEASQVGDTEIAKEASQVEDMEIAKEASEVEDLVLEEATTLLKGEAGAGKSSVAAKVVQKWSEGTHMKNITCCLFLAAGSDIKIPLYKIIWDEYSDVQRWKETEAKEAFAHLQSLADEGKLAVVIDGLDELGPMTIKDVENASRIASHIASDISIMTTCTSILTKRILPGAKVLATGRNTKLVNTEILEGKGSMHELIGLTKADRENLVHMMEPDPSERQRIQNELDRLSVAGNEYFMKTPLMTKIIIQLSKDKLVDIEMVKNSTEIYLMVVMQN